MGYVIMKNGTCNHDRFVQFKVDSCVDLNCGRRKMKIFQRFVSSLISLQKTLSLK